MTEARRRVKAARGRRVCFKHIPREENSLADWLCHVALKQHAHAPAVERVFPTLMEGSAPPAIMDLEEMVQVPAMPAPPRANTQFVVLDGTDKWGGDTAEGATCTTCCREITEDQVCPRCWGCGTMHHG